MQLPTATPDYVAFSSMGNDSIALIQWAAEKGLTNVWVVHSDTGWAAEFWQERVDRAAEWVRQLGFHYVNLPSEGMLSLVRRKKAWPRNGIQFCTQELKIKPAERWLEQVDPDAEAICLVGVRREESRARSTWPVWTEESDKHGGRSLWSPLAPFNKAERDELIERSPFDVLDHPSAECWPCINANRSDIRRLSPERVEFIAQIEDGLGFTSKGKPRTFFRPYRHMGAVGIREVAKWAHSERGAYQPPVELGSGPGCDSGWCAS